MPTMSADKSIDTDLLASVLRSNGFLGSATVKSVELTQFETNGIGSEFYKARLAYSSDDHQLPDRMVIKRPLVGDRGQGEANVYELVLGRATDLPVMGYFGFIDEAADKPLYLLFEDLSDSHDQTPWPIVPSLAECQRAVATLADVHAHWWGRAESIDAGTAPVATHCDPNHLAKFFPEFVDFVGEYLAPARVASYERVFSDLDALISDRLTNGNATLLHTDSHFWNFLYPKDAQQNRCVIFDWPLWNIGLGGSDLAYMIALHLYPEHRRRFEPVLLERYCQVLAEHGVGYQLEDVLLDYRVGVIFGLLMPVMEFSWKIPPLDWMPKLEKAFAAYEELNCQALFESA